MFYGSAKSERHGYTVTQVADQTNSAHETEDANLRDILRIFAPSRFMYEDCPWLVY